jgi:leader peptidase (prepilin peptidase)/N-methyltransferase
VDFFLACVLAVAGLIFGSFLNVCISRIPRDESVVSPRSRCPRCGRPIRWCHNIPIFSFVWLKGRCADCRAPISVRYPLVELLTAALFVACFAKFDLSLALLKSCVFDFLLIGLIFMDAETGLLPAEFTYTGIGMGLLFAGLVPGDSSGSEFLLRVLGIHTVMGVRQASFLDAIIAMFFGAAFFYCIWALYYLVRKRHGLGFGDIALIAMCGAFLGLKLTLFVLFSAPLLGCIYAVGWVGWNAMRTSRGPATSGESRLSTAEMLRLGEVPFGVFLGTCSLLAVFWGERAWDIYLSWVNLR